MAHSPAPPRTMPRYATQEHGFTIIEIVIAVVLLGVVLALAMGGMVRSLQSSDAQPAGELSDSAVARTLEYLGRDVGDAFAPDREAARIRDVSELRRAVVFGATIQSGDPAESGRTLDVRDVLRASRTELQVRAEVFPGSPGAECVHYRVDRGSEWRLRRSVHGGATCAGPVLEDQVLARLAPGTSGLPTEPFSYELVCSPSVCAGSAATGAAPCRPWTVADVPDARLGWIAAVRFDIASTGSRRRAVNRATTSELVTIRSRETGTYREALGC